MFVIYLNAFVDVGKAVIYFLSNTNMDLDLCTNVCAYVYIVYTLPSSVSVPVEFS